MLKDLTALYERDLNKLIQELEAYPNEAALWAVQGEIINSAGTLIFHLIGNLSKFIGDDLGGVAFSRDREAEFGRRDIPKQELLAGLNQTRAVVVKTLNGLDESRLTDVFPGQLPPNFQNATIQAFLIHLYGHLNWHLGQVDYHRRMIGSKPASSA